MLFSRLQHFLNPFTMLPVKGSFETGLIGHISSHVFRSVWFRKEISYEGHLFFENVLNLMQISEISQKNSEKAFCFSDNCVRIGCVKFSLLRREYLSSAVNVLTNSYKALRLTKTDFFRLNYLPNDQ